MGATSTRYRSRVLLPAPGSPTTTCCVPRPSHVSAGGSRSDASTRQGDTGGPVLMLNLLRFAGEDGRRSYARYGDLVAPLLAAAGAVVVEAVGMAAWRPTTSGRRGTIESPRPNGTSAPLSPGVARRRIGAKAAVDCRR